MDARWTRNIEVMRTGSTRAVALNVSEAGTLLLRTPVAVRQWDPHGQRQALSRGA